MAALLFLGCPTEADSEPESTAYERTALWAAIVAAETNLSSTPVSVSPDVIDPAPDGGDVVETAKWVSTAQYNAFKRAIDDARTVAYTLSRAAAPTPAEEPAIATLTAAQTVFDNQKAPGKADPLLAGDVASVSLAGSTDRKIVTGVTSTASLSVGHASAILTVAPGATLTATGTGTTITITGALRVKAGGTFKINDGVNGTSQFNGTLVLESGATSIDLNEGGASLTGSGTTTVHAGATVITYSQALNPGSDRYQNVILIGPATGSNKGQVIQLNSGTLKTNSSTPFYKLDGDATLVAEHGVPSASSTDDGLIITATSTLTVAAGGNLFCYPVSDFLKNSEEGAKIVLSDASSRITLKNGSAIGTAPTWTSGISWDIDDPKADDNIFSGYITGPAVLVYTDTDDTVGPDTWVKQ
jgi:hypothetical protein